MQGAFATLHLPRNAIPDADDILPEAECRPQMTSCRMQRASDGIHWTRCAMQFTEDGNAGPIFAFLH